MFIPRQSGESTMKIKSDHYAALKSALQTVITFNPGMLEYWEKQGRTPKRMRWDLFSWCVINPKCPCAAEVTLSELYAYLNDDHIDTALRRIMCEIKR